MERRLSDRESDVLRLFGEGRTASEIAAALGMAESTVVWLIGHLVAERGARETSALAQRLAHPRASGRRRWIPQRARFAVPAAVPMAIVGLIGIAVIALASTGTLHGPWIAPAAPRSASPTTFASGTPHSLGTQGGAARTPGPAAPGTAAPAASATPQDAVPTANGAVLPTNAPQVLRTAIPAPALPSLAPAPLPPTLPAPSLPLPLPPLPTVPPLPTPHL